MHILINSSVKAQGGFSTNEAIIKLMQHTIQTSYSRDENGQEVEQYTLSASASIYRSVSDYEIEKLVLLRLMLRWVFQSSLARVR